MRRFRFSLDTVLRVRRGREEKIQLEFSAILERRARCLRSLAAEEQELEEMVASQSGLRTGRLDAASIAIFETSRLAQLDKIVRRRIQLREISAELEAKRFELVAASRERKVLEKLEENQYEDYLKRFNREEQAFLDELASHNSAQWADIPT